MPLARPRRSLGRTNSGWTHSPVLPVLLFWFSFICSSALTSRLTRCCRLISLSTMLAAFLACALAPCRWQAGPPVDDVRLASRFSAKPSSQPPYSFVLPFHEANSPHPILHTSPKRVDTKPNTSQSLRKKSRIPKSANHIFANRIWAPFNSARVLVQRCVLRPGTPATRIPFLLRPF